MSKRPDTAAALTWLKATTTPRKPAPVPRVHRAAIRRLAAQGLAELRTLGEARGTITQARLYASLPESYVPSSA